MNLTISAWQCVAILVDFFLAGFAWAAGHWAFSKIGR